MNYLYVLVSGRLSLPAEGGGRKRYGPRDTVPLTKAQAEALGDRVRPATEQDLIPTGSSSENHDAAIEEPDDSVEAADGGDPEVEEASLIETGPVLEEDAVELQMNTVWSTVARWVRDSNQLAEVKAIQERELAGRERIGVLNVIERRIQELSKS